MISVFAPDLILVEVVNAKSIVFMLKPVVCTYQNAYPEVIHIWKEVFFFLLKLQLPKYCTLNKNKDISVEVPIFRTEQGLWQLHRYRSFGTW
jgi:hypothetical protein